MSTCRRPAIPGRRGCGSNCTIWSGRGCIAPIAGAVGYSADRLNRLQFLTIRRYLSLVFATLVTLLLVLAIWS